jgi:hypothetical protein
LDHGYVVLLHGSAFAEVSGPSGVERYSGEQAVTWLDRRLEAPFDRLSVGCGDRPVQVDPRSDLRAGLVPGSGFVLTPAAAPALSGPAAPEPGPAGTEAAAPEPEPASLEPEAAAPEQKPAASAPAAGELGPDAAAPEQEPAAPEQEPASAAAATGPGPEAYEALAAEPAQLVIALAGPEAAEPSLAAATQTDAGPFAATVTDLQPAGEAAQRHGPVRATQAVVVPVGQLVASDGIRIPLDRAYVLGREPENDPAVRSGAATPVRLTDQDNLISRVHSYVTVEAGQVSLSDASSANGTYLAAPGDQAWTRVGTDPVVLPPTWSIRLGNQVFTYVATTASS